MLPAIDFKKEIKREKSVEIGFFAFNFSLNFDGKITPVKSDIDITIKNDEIEITLEREINDRITTNLSANAKKSNLDAIINAVRNKDKKSFGAALAKVFNIEGTFQGIKIADPIDSEIDIRFDKLPVAIKLSGHIDDTYSYHGNRLSLKSKITGTFYFGLSNKGWSEITKRGGRIIVEQFLKTATRFKPLLSLLTAEGILVGAVAVAGGVVITGGIMVSLDIMMKSTYSKGEMEGLVTWYLAGFQDRVWRKPGKTIPINNYAKKKEMYSSGVRDAVTLGRKIAKINGEQDYLTASDDNIMARYREILKQTKTNESQLEKTIKTKIKQKYGV